MKNKRLQLAIVVLMLSSLVVAGCETAAGSAGLGAGIGGLAGGIIGHQSGHGWEGAAIGAALGGLTGLIVHDIKSRQVKTAQQTAQEYNYQPAQGFKMDMRGGSVSPGTVQAGQKVTSTMQYAVLGAGSGVKVDEKAELHHNGEVVAKLAERTVDRTDGTWENELAIEVPKDAPTGEYVIAQRVSAGGQNYGRDSTFNVTTVTAKSPAVTVGGEMQVRVAAVR
ncbi:MAG TPA: YMGG-like glycine zipper-containing protein [Candidatus Bathyarchaeia archaeon]|nr:YMGG-like glycine zipper-containing protein [Candidatus Bathyarchaeia archaeon]